MASIVSAMACSSARSTRKASTWTSAATAVMNVVPLISASASLGAKRIGVSARGVERFERGQALPSELGLALPDQHARDVCGRHQVAARADRSVARHDRRHSAIQQRASASTSSLRTAEVPVTKVATRSSMAARTTSVGSGAPVAQPRWRDQVVLERLHLLRRERDPDVAADAGVDAVDALAALPATPPDARGPSRCACARRR